MQLPSPSKLAERYHIILFSLAFYFKDIPAEFYFPNKFNRAFISDLTTDNQAGTGVPQHGGGMDTMHEVPGQW